MDHFGEDFTSTDSSSVATFRAPALGVRRPFVVDESLARRLIADQLGLSSGSVVASATLGDLGADPLDVVALVLALEKAFGVRIDEAEADTCRTVGDLLDAVRTARPLRRETLSPVGV
ncbi:hypothetical protein E2493_02125 [Sphingomonas parva]|uniref:Acyl carrier protein n=1 Tax=Sphingomonas parva TaxID=2555898 RepID=A0A4Y8ZXT1_9SPHN|nr:phosphopantetheine-binding protein [Sphingomonas parva]TFI60065.1 hypothetical protein E2493_02125 [Sphingomonas parva]